MADKREGESTVVRYGCVGCLTVVAGISSGGMVGVFLAKVVGSFRNCAPPAGIPACNWQVYALVGMLIGAITLPVMALRRLRAGERDARNSE